MSAERQLKKALTHLILGSQSMPFFGNIVLSMQLQEDPTIESISTNGKVLKYNPFWVNEMTTYELTTAIAHQALHTALLHPFRRNERDKKIWNMATDYVVNSELMSSGYALPAEALYDQNWADWSAEKIYAELESQAQNKPDGCQGGSGSGGESNDDQKGKSKGDKDKQDKQDQQQGQGEGDGQGQGESNPDEKPDYGGTGNITDGSSDPQEQQQAMQEVIALINVCKGCGQVPAMVERTIHDLLAPAADWHDILREFIKARAKDDYSWLKPNRRFLYLGMYLPSNESQKIDEMVIGIDTSGSISQEELRNFMSEIASILSTFREPEVNIIQCDTEVKSNDLVTDLIDLEEIEVHGGGGTRFAPVFDEVEEMGLSPSCMIYFTDGHCDDFPNYEPGYPVLWILDQRENSAHGYGINESFEPPFGEKLVIQ